MKITIDLTVTGDRDETANKFMEKMIAEANLLPALEKVTEATNAMNAGETYGLTINMAFAIDP